MTVSDTDGLDQWLLSDSLDTIDRLHIYCVLRTVSEQ